MKSDFESLRSLADNIGIKIGTCVSHQHLDNDPEYAKILAHEFNTITCENELKFRFLCPIKGAYNFEPAEKLMAFANKHNMEFRGHVLIWDDQLPDWLLNGGYSRTELIGILKEHILTVVSRFAGRIKIWDVVNEAIDNNGVLKKTFWYTGIGQDYIEIAFHAARNADSAAKLYYNDQGFEGSAEHHEAVYKLLKKLLQNNVPVDGIGLQMHLSLRDYEEYHGSALKIERLKKLGLELDITELDVRIENGVLNQAQQLERQAAIFASIFNYFIIEKRCTTFIMWGFTDRYSWIPFFYPLEGNATIMSEYFLPKPAYWALQQEFYTSSNSTYHGRV